MNKLRYIILICLSGLALIDAQAQVSVQAKIDSISILIGQQAHMTVDVTAPKGARVQWQTWKGPRAYLVPGVEILDISKSDTVDADGGKMTVSKVFTLTSFDEHLYPLPGINVKVNGKNYKANSLALKVVTVDVDTLHPNQFFPPKDVQNNPFQWSEWSTVFWLALLMLLLCGVGVYLYIRLKQNKPVITRTLIVKKILPHQKALNAIDKIKAEHLQTSEDQKTYYTKLTDAIRQYIYERFGFNAMEMTSSEIISHLQETGDQKMMDELRELFQTADLVKFAKYSTLINENDMNLVNAVNFIDQTKQEGGPTEERIVPKLTEAEQRTRQSRIALKTSLWVLAAVVVALLVYVVYSVYELLI